jgi:hypothetical protein
VSFAITAAAFARKHLSANEALPGQEGLARRSRLTQWEEVASPEGREFKGVFELADGSGGVEEAHYFGKWIYHGRKTYTVIQRFAPTRFTAALLCITCATRGKLAGNNRLDKFAVTSVDDHGTVTQREFEAEVLLANPYGHLSPVDAAAMFLKDQIDL